MRILTYTVTVADDGRAVRSVVPRRFCLGQHAFRRLKVLGAIRIGGAPVRADYVLRAGDIIEVRLPSDMAQESDAASSAAPAGLPPSFLRYQDEDMLIVSKGAPLPTLPARHIASGTLREQVMRYLGEREPYTFRPVNRLDKGTSGLMLVARNAHAQQLASRMLHTDAFVREYLAVTQGVPACPEGVIDAPVARMPGATVRRCVDAGGQQARTQYRLLGEANGRALLRLRLFTGRTHQIRVHLSHIGCPIVGDYLYGREEESLPGRFALHSAYVSLTQPVTGERIEIESPLPPALARLI